MSKMGVKAGSNDIRVESWCDLCERLYENSWQQDLLRFRSNFAFRGLSDKAYRLTNSFTRRCGSYAHLEYHLPAQFLQICRGPLDRRQRLGLALADHCSTPRTADPASGLDLFSICGRPFRHGGHGSL